MKVSESKNKLTKDNHKKEITKFLAERIEKILKSRKSPSEKKLALFNLVKDFEVGTVKSRRMNYLLESRLYHELSKQSMKEYKKTTAEEFSKVG